MIPKAVLVIILAIFTRNGSIISAASIKDAANDSDPNWWKHSVIYQIYPRSFKDDVKEDGNGDLRGIVNKLDHLKDAGIAAAWLSPIYKSPGADQGYDISNFKEIEEKFGTMKDFEDLIRAAHEKGIKIVMDFVPNHSSNEHQWFIDSENKKEGFEDFYVWRNGTNGNPPNNWKSRFGGSAWEYSTKRGEWYYHQFLIEQPDLNYRSPKLVKEMKDVLKFWMDKGVDGFRMDAVPYLIEDIKFEDETPIPGTSGDEWEHYKHEYTSDQPDTFDMIYQWREFVEEYTQKQGGDARILMTEAYTDIETTMKYYGNSEGRLGAHFTFNFQFITKVNGESTAKEIVAAIKEWLDHMPRQYTANWVLGNHDNRRVASRFSPQNADGFNMLIGILPGVMVTYNGEEIGQEDGEVSYEQCQDISVCDKGEEIFKEKGRDFERTPFHWDGTVNAGFNDGTEPWLPVSEKYIKNNLAAQSDPTSRSHYQVYKQLVVLRNQDIFIDGNLEINSLSNNVLGSVRALKGNNIVFVFNIGETAETVNLDELYDFVTPYVEVLLTNSDSSRSAGQLIPSKGLNLAPHESIIANSTTRVPHGNQD